MHPTKEKIIQKSLNLFGHKGYDKTSMQDIMSATGLSKGALYHHFKSKEGIADSAVAEFARKLKIEFDAILKQDMSALEKLLAISAAEQKVLADQQDGFMSILASTKSIKLKNKILVANREQFIPVMTYIIQQGKKEKTFICNESPAVVAHFVFGIQESFHHIPSEIISDTNECKVYQLAGVRLMCKVMGIDVNFLDPFIK